MSLQATRAVWESSSATGTDLLVMLALADFCHKDDPSAWPSVATLAAKTRMDRRRVQRAIARLEALGELSIEPGGGRGRSNRYRIAILANGGISDAVSTNAISGISGKETAVYVTRKGGISGLKGRTAPHKVVRNGKNGKNYKQEEERESARHPSASQEPNDQVECPRCGNMIGKAALEMRCAGAHYSRGDPDRDPMFREALEGQRERTHVSLVPG